MDFGRAFTFVFDDPDWLRKIAINALIGLIPIIGAIYLLGWGLEVTRRIVTHSSEQLPDVDFGTYLNYGFKAFVVSLVWTLPLWLLTLLGTILFTSVSTVDPDAANVIAVVSSVCGGGLVLIFLIAIGLLLPPAMARTVVHDSIGAGLDFGAVWVLLRAAPGPWVLALLGILVASILASIVGSIACGIGIIFTMAWYQAVMGHFFGQAYLASEGVR